MNLLPRQGGLVGTVAPLSLHEDIIHSGMAAKSENKPHTYENLFFFLVEIYCFDPTIISPP